MSWGLSIISPDGPSLSEGEMFVPVSTSSVPSHGTLLLHIISADLIHVCMETKARTLVLESQICLSQAYVVRGKESTIHSFLQYSEKQLFETKREAAGAGICCPPLYVFCHILASQYR